MPVRYRRMIGEGEEEARIGHILATLFNHQTHHRGQVSTLLSQQGIDVGITDIPMLPLLNTANSD